MPSVQTVQEMVNILQVEFVDRDVPVPVVKQRHVPVIQKVPRHMEAT